MSSLVVHAPERFTLDNAERSIPRIDLRSIGALHLNQGFDHGTRNSISTSGP
jgi:hypothetical protein